MKKKQIIAIAIACAAVLIVGLAGVLSSRAGSDSHDKGPRYYVSVIPIYNTIGEVSYDLFGNEVSLSASAIVDYLYDITYDDNNKGLFLQISSPGGAVYDSDKIYQAIMEYKEATGRPVVAACLSQMCSGAYYIACSADEIYAERTADVGSIGVYIEMIDISKLCETLGVSVDYIRSSENKAMGNMYNPLTEEQREIYQSIIDECYDRFTGIVMEARGYDQETVRKIADGRAYTATQGLEIGLIDGIKEYDDALADFEEELGVWWEDYPYVKSEDWLSALVGRITGALPMNEASLLKKLLESGSGKAMYYAG